MAELIWTEKAVEQIEELGSFIGKDSPFQARRVVQLIIKETRKLKEFSHFGKMIPEVQEERSDRQGLKFEVGSLKLESAKLGSKRDVCLFLHFTLLTSYFRSASRRLKAER